jgi:hypothetical protein
MSYELNFGVQNSAYSANAEIRFDIFIIHNL